VRYQITHRTEYTYGETVPLCHNVARLRPRDLPRQTCLRHELAVSPAPAFRRDRLDFFGNHVSSFSLQEPHRGLSVTARSEVDVGAPVDGLVLPGVPWEEAVARLSMGPEPELRAARAFVFASPRARHDAGLAGYARPSFPPGRPLAEAVLDLTRRIHDEFRFVPGVTSVGTTPEEVFRTREGVCQDFAHLEIACLRSMGLAARYVSGYVLTDPPAGSLRLPGADASHAWIAVHHPGFGWVDYDPTRGAMPGDAHVTAAWARDYDDVAPIKGVLIGGLNQTLKVAVDLVPLSGAGAPPPAA
jgi:transglutaminase-like putative cysteine protease